MEKGGDSAITTPLVEPSTTSTSTSNASATATSKVVVAVDARKQEKRLKKKAKQAAEPEFGEFFDMWESEEEYETSTFRFDSVEVKLTHLGAHLENTYLIGQMVWPDAEVLCHYIALNKEIFAGKTVLDLGSGPGLTGFFVAKFCKRVVLTDLEDKVVSLLQKNADELTDKNVEVAKLAWGVGVDEFLQKYGPFDIVMGSGIVYDSDFVAALIETVGATLAPFKAEKQEHPEDADPDYVYEKQDRGLFITSNFNYRWIRQVPIIDRTTAALGLKQRKINMQKLVSVVREREQERQSRGETPNTFIEDGKNFSTHNICIMKW